MKKLLIKLALKILGHYKYRAFMIKSELDPIIHDARILVNALDIRHPATSGEYKRHQCYAALLKKYPQAEHRDVAMAIELVIQGV